MLKNFNIEKIGKGHHLCKQQLLVLLLEVDKHGGTVADLRLTARGQHWLHTQLKLDTTPSLPLLLAP